MFSLDDLLTDVQNLKLRMTSAEERISHLEDAKIALQQEVARLVRLELGRQQREQRPAAVGD